MEKIFTLAGLELEPAPTPELVIDADVPASTVLYGKTAAELQQNISISAEKKITGKLFYLSNYEDYPGATKQGNFLALHVTKQPADAVVDIVFRSTHYAPDANGYVVIPITSTQSITAYLKVDGETVITQTYTTSGLTKQQPLTASIYIPGGEQNVTDGKTVADLQDNIQDSYYPTGLTGTCYEVDSLPTVSADANAYYVAFVLNYPIDATAAVAVTDGNTTKQAYLDQDGLVVAELQGSGFGPATSLTITLTRDTDTWSATYDLSGISYQQAPQPTDNWLSFSPMLEYKGKQAGELHTVDTVEYDDQDGYYLPQGSINYVSGWQSFSDDPDHQSGYYVMAHVDKPDETAAVDVISSALNPDDVQETLYPDENGVICAWIKYTESEEDQGQMLTEWALAVKDNYGNRHIYWLTGMKPGAE